MADLPVPKEPQHVTVPDADYRALEEKARLADHLAARLRALDEEVRSLRSQIDGSSVMRIVRDVLVQVDDFERAILSARKKEDYAAILRGLETIRSGLLHTLSRQKIKPFPALGKPFDPSRHEVLEGEEVASGERVVEELRAGYEWKGQIIRKAWVRVGPVEASSSQPGGSTPPPPDPPSN